MQTFLPYADYTQSAKVLDRARLGKQRVEVKQILNTLLGKSTGWTNHPAVRMWKGHEAALARYGIAVCEEWRGRGYKDQLGEEFTQVHAELVEADPQTDEDPAWVQDEEVHLSHRSNLIRKDPEHYQELWPELDGTLAYKWPV